MNLEVQTGMWVMRRLGWIGLAAAGVLSVAAADWSVFRGDAGLRGVAKESPRPPLTRAWSVRPAGGATSSPVIAGDRIVLGVASNRLAALDTADGSVVWTAPARAPVEAPPLIAGDRVVAADTSGELFAADLATGRRLWSYSADDKILGSPNLVELPGGRRLAVAGSYDSRIHAVDLDTGVPAWTHEAESYINGSPAVIGERVIAGSCDNLIYVIRAEDGGLDRSFDAGSHAAASPAAEAGFMVAGTFGGEVVAADPGRGEILWRSASPKRSAFFSSPAMTRERVFIGCRDNRLYALRRADGSVAWTFAAGGAVDASPVVCGDHVLAAADDGRLMLLHADDGREIWQADVGAAIPGFPAVTSERILVVDADGWLHAFRSAAPPAGGRPSSLE